MYGRCDLSTSSVPKKAAQPFRDTDISIVKMYLRIYTKLIMFFREGGVLSFNPILHIYKSILTTFCGGLSGCSSGSRLQPLYI
jgi:hypothetical protein